MGSRPRKNGPRAQNRRANGSDEPDATRSRRQAVRASQLEARNGRLVRLAALRAPSFRREWGRPQTRCSEGKKINAPDARKRGRGDDGAWEIFQKN